MTQPVGVILVNDYENEYNIITYYRAPGARFDKVIGIGSASSTNITN